LGSATFWDFTQYSTVVSSRASRSLKMGPIGYPETSVNNHRSTLRKIPPSPPPKKKRTQVSFTPWRKS
jgi:hypothetical protein